MLIKLTRVEIQRPTATHETREHKIKVLGPVLVNPLNAIRMNGTNVPGVTEIVTVTHDIIYVKESLETIEDLIQEMYL